MTDVADDLALALRLADQADALTMDRFGALDLAIETKPDLTPVTDADKGAEETLRAILTEARPGDGYAAAREVGVPEGSSLLVIATHAPAPWRELLTEHHRAFVELTEQVNELAEGNRELLATSSRAAQETLLSLQESVSTYDDRGATTAAAAGASLLDRAL